MPAPIRHLLNSKTFCLVVLTLLVLCGCESQQPKVVRLYPGPSQPREALSLISIREPEPGNPEGHDGALWLREVDGKTCYAGTAAVLPGKHVFGLMYAKWIPTRDGIERKRSKGYARIPLETQPNHIYLLHGRITSDETWTVLAMDVTTQVTRNESGVILFSKKFEDYWMDHILPADKFKERSAFP